MKVEIGVSEFRNYFRAMDRDYFSYDGYEALFDHYEQNENYVLDVIEICSDWTEYAPTIENDALYQAAYDYNMEDDIEAFKDASIIMELPNNNVLVMHF